MSTRAVGSCRDHLGGDLDPVGCRGSAGRARRPGPGGREPGQRLSARGGHGDDVEAGRRPGRARPRRATSGGRRRPSPGRLVLHGRDPTQPVPRAGRTAPTRCPSAPVRQPARCRRAPSTRPRIDRATPSRPSRLGLRSRPSGMPGPSSRTVTTTCVGRAAPAAPRPAPAARRARPRCPGRPGPRRPPRRPAPPPGLDPRRRGRDRHDRWSRRLQPLRARRRGRPGPRRVGRPRPVRRISARSALSCSPASRPSSARSPPSLGCRGAAPGPAPGARRRGRPGPAAPARRRPRQPLGPVALDGHPLQRARTCSRRSGRRSSAGRGCRSWSG